MYSFSYSRPGTIDEAISIMADDEDAKLLAGGQTLIPTMKQRLAAPGRIVDLGNVKGLRGIHLQDGNLVIKAMTVHADVASSPVVRNVIPGLASLAGGIGDPAVRNRGTIGGSVANNDPAADYPSACLALGATIVTNLRRIHAEEFFVGMFETALEANEIILEFNFPVPRKSAYAKFPNPASRYALVGVFVADVGSEVHVAVTGAGMNGVFRAVELEAALTERFEPEALENVSVSPDDLVGDIHASAEYRAEMVRVMARRAVSAALASS
ncbi:Carbon monoxide dehydrogenase medium chain [Hyphomicrobiales bacterium]|nr:Carbon monoxide dehydrogenase medium chain [Hyphomicrobiales bacterium]